VERNLFKKVSNAKFLVLRTNAGSYLTDLDSPKFFNNTSFKSNDFELFFGPFDILFTSLKSQGITLKAIMRKGEDNNLFFIPYHYETLNEDMFIIALGNNVILKNPQILKEIIDSSLSGKVIKANILEKRRSETCEVIDEDKGVFFKKDIKIKEFGPVFSKMESDFFNFVIFSINQILTEILMIGDNVVYFIFEKDSQMFKLTVSNFIINFIKSFGETYLSTAIVNTVYNSGEEYLEKNFATELGKFFDEKNIDLKNDGDKFLFFKHFFLINKPVKFEDPESKDVNNLLSYIKANITSRDIFNIITEIKEYNKDMLSLNEVNINELKLLLSLLKNTVIDQYLAFPYSSFNKIIPLMEKLMNAKENSTIRLIKIGVFNELFEFSNKLIGFSTLNADEKKAIKKFLDYLTKLYNHIKNIKEANIPSSQDFNKKISEALQKIADFDMILPAIEFAVQELNLKD